MAKFNSPHHLISINLLIANSAVGLLPFCSPHTNDPQRFGISHCLTVPVSFIDDPKKTLSVWFQTLASPKYKKISVC